SSSPDKCKEIVADQKDDGCIELIDTVCDELDAPKEEIIMTIQKNITDKKLQLPNLPSLKQIGDANTEKELEECADNYVVENCIKVIKDKRRNSVREVQKSATPEKCGDIMSNQKDLL
ncbi:7672_t:CDS:2, partial [Racocetra persica]